ncbi:hypothetical protein ON010_g1774 [Phytophthora cinnamomi]|nr:hypothetical protein ON010_g1774 [Phytophthora cinnamomi]
MPLRGAIFQTPDYGRCGRIGAGPAASCSARALDIEAADRCLRWALAARSAGDDRTLPGLSRVETMWTATAALLTFG